jgi:amidase
VSRTAIPFDNTRSLQEEITLSLNMIQNTCPFDLTGHPALSVPCGFVNGLPIGLMLVGRRWEDTTVLRAAAGFETLGLGALKNTALAPVIPAQSSSMGIQDGHGA